MGPQTPPETTPFVRQDASICSHLLVLIAPPTAGATDDGEMSVKLERLDSTQGSVSGEPAGVDQSAAGLNPRKAAIERRFIEVVRWGARDEGVKRRRVVQPQCNTCSTSLTRPWACLTCPYIGCLSISPSTSTGGSRDCIQQHWSESNGSCHFAIDPISGAIFCASCDDATYPDTFDSLFRLTRIRVEEEHDASREYSIIGKGRERGQWKPWTSHDADPSSGPERSPCRGLRPLLNLSQTCFLSAILQALIHNPLLKAYFLSDKHNRHVCTNGSRGLGLGKPYLGPDGSVGPDREKGCMCCEMDRAFEEFHNEDKSPFGPVTMLYAMWHASAELEGYGQQDAHSFFLAALDQIHAHAKGQLSSCNCIAHQTFAGSLLSAVTCSGCRTTNTTIDPILDIQLDFPTNNSDPDALTLTSMLRRFCAEESVGDMGKGYDCSSCGGGAGIVALRKLSLKKLPPVLSFQLKRFAHNATSTKVELPVRFPSHLDMQPYVETPSTDVAPLPASLYGYDLFAVVTHEGKLDNGHYWADVLNGGEWWHCDDDKVTPTSLKAVLEQKAYMLFYVKRSLAYARPMSELLSSTANFTTNVNVNNNATNGSTNGSNVGVNGAETTADSSPITGRIGHAIVGMTV